MNSSLFTATFATIFVAELGDKTQLAVFGAAAASEGGRWTVFVGGSLALVATSALAMMAGAALGKLVPLVGLERFGGVLFMALGVWTLWRSFGE